MDSVFAHGVGVQALSRTTHLILVSWPVNLKRTSMERGVCSSLLGAGMRITILNLTTGIIAALLGAGAVPVTAAGTPQSRGDSISAAQAADSIDEGQLGTRVRNGTVLSVSPMHMVISCRQDGKVVQLDFELNGGTVQKGRIVVGSPVTVHYRTLNSRNFATSIQLRRSPGRVEPDPASNR